MRSLAIELSPGSDLRQSLEDIGRNENSSGFVLGVVGNLSNVRFQCPGRSKPTELTGNLEIITLNGTISPDNVHLHLSISDSNCQVWGGHLELGSIVLKGVDLLVGLLDNEVSNKTKTDFIVETNSPRLEVAVLPGCPWSARALRILKSADVPHNIITISNEIDYENHTRRSDMNTFPQLFLDGSLIGGYDSLTELRSSGRLNELR